jgi:hypothetical protein
MTSLSELIQKLADAEKNYDIVCEDGNSTKQDCINALKQICEAEKALKKQQTKEKRMKKTPEPVVAPAPKMKRPAVAKE